MKDLFEFPPKNEKIKSQNTELNPNKKSIKEVHIYHHYDKDNQKYDSSSDENSRPDVTPENKIKKRKQSTTDYGFNPWGGFDF